VSFGRFSRELLIVGESCSELRLVCLARSIGETLKLFSGAYLVYDKFNGGSLYVEWSRDYPVLTQRSAKVLAYLLPAALCDETADGASGARPVSGVSADAARPSTAPEVPWWKFDDEIERLELVRGADDRAAFFNGYVAFFKEVGF